MPPDEHVSDRSAPPVRPPCWGIGLSRSGTNTLCEALRLLGYERVVHNPSFPQLAGLEGGADIGVVVFYKYLDYKFPGSKFVLTVRSIASWLDSMEWLYAHQRPVTRANDLAIQRRMAIYETVVFDRDAMTAAYHRHHADVRRYFARRPNDLLEIELDAPQGWERLCAFLGLPEPAAPYPWLHDRRSGSTFSGPPVAISGAAAP